MQKTYSNQRLNSSVVVGGLLSGQSIATIQQPFILSEVEYMHLRGNPPLTASWATNLLFAVIGYGVSLGPKFFALFRGQDSELSSAEWMTLLIGVIASGVLYLVGLALPNDRKKLMRRIADHFKNAPASHRVLREDQ